MIPFIFSISNVNANMNFATCNKFVASFLTASVVARGDLGQNSREGALRSAPMYFSRQKNQISGLPIKRMCGTVATSWPKQNGRTGKLSENFDIFTQINTFFSNIFTFLQDIAQLELLCKQLYEAADATARKNAEKALVNFTSSPDCLTKCQFLLERGNVRICNLK